MTERGRDYFNGLAERWDDIRAADGGKIAGLVGLAGLRAGAAVLDAGCGTGVLIPYLRAAVGETGRITAVDYAANMIARAQEKFGGYENVSLVTGDIRTFAPEACFDAVFCFNFFPHVADKPAFVAKVRGMLREGGALIIMHDMSRRAVNAIHKGNDVVHGDRLPAGEAVAAMQAVAGYEVRLVIDDEERYFIKAVKTAQRDGNDGL